MAGGGWSSAAPDRARRAYRLNKMDSRHTLQGRVTEEAVRWVLREAQAGRKRTVEEAYEAVARPALNAAWKSSKSGAWRDDPKRNVCLHEQYYPDLHAELDPAWPSALRDHVQRCIGHFIATVLPRLEGVTPADEVPLGAPESFEIEGVTIYAVPDYVYVRDGQWHIHDWKAGRPKPEHLKQLAIYALWAREKHGVAAEQIRVYVEYLSTGQVCMEPVTDQMMEEALAFIAESVADMADYLEDGDWRANRPLPQAEWDMTTEHQVCRRCNFYELCKPEFVG